MCDQAEESEELAFRGGLSGSSPRQRWAARGGGADRAGGAFGARRRVNGNEHPDTLESASNLAALLSGQGKHAEGERIEREVVGAMKRVLGDEHPETLKSAGNLASSLLGQWKYAEAERIQREVLGVQRRPGYSATSVVLKSSPLPGGERISTTTASTIVVAVSASRLQSRVVNSPSGRGARACRYYNRVDNCACRCDERALVATTIARSHPPQGSAALVAAVSARLSLLQLCCRLSL